MKVKDDISELLKRKFKEPTVKFDELTQYNIRLITKDIEFKSGKDGENVSSIMKENLSQHKQVDIRSKNYEALYILGLAEEKAKIDKDMLLPHYQRGMVYLEIG